MFEFLSIILQQKEKKNESGRFIFFSEFKMETLKLAGVKLTWQGTCMYVLKEYIQEVFSFTPCYKTC